MKAVINKIKDWMIIGCVLVLLFIGAVLDVEYEEFEEEYY